MSATTVPVSAPQRPARGFDLRRLWRGPAGDPAWARPALLGLLAVTAVLYLFNLSRNGYANDFYAAAVQAGTRSWKAFFFGSFDSSNFITVDKTPASLWVMELSARVFGFNSWSMLAPEALEGVLSVALLYLAVKRWFGPGAGLIAGAVLALTPAAALIFRFNNPDALLVLLMTASAYCVQRAIERDRTRWLVFAGLLLGFGFLAKMMQAFLVVPGFAVAYLWAGPARVRRRLWQVVVFGGSVVLGAGWWVAIAQLTPAADRPYFGGSTNNSILELALGYNGLGRLDGTETGSIGFNSSSVGGGGGPGGAGFGGSTGIFRLFQSEFGGQVSWLLPAALISLGALLWVSRRSVRAWHGLAAASDGTAASSSVTRMRAFAAIWGGWLLVTGLVFSFMQGIIHPYYMVALGPAIGALVGVGASSLWQARLGMAGRVWAAIAVAVTAVWSFMLLDRTPAWLPWLRWVVLIAGLLAVAALFAVPALAGGRHGRYGLDWRNGRLASRMAFVPLGFGLVAGLAGPLAYSLDTVNSTHTGSIPSAGPQVAGAFGGPGGGGGGGFRGGFPGRGGFGGTGSANGSTGSTGNGSAASGFPGGSTNGGGFPGGSTGGSTGGSVGGTGTQGGSTGTGGTPSGFPGGGAGGGMGGLGGNTQVSSALIKLLEQDASKYKWIAATEGTQEAAPIELATGGEAVLAIGGFNGSDPAPTLAEFEALVAKHEIHYYVGRGSNSFGGGTGSSAIASWVAAHFTAKTVGGVTVYDLTQAK
jgi:4-amino-4-deoxy-L-arabinose transferase-like glycosyltransferase